MRSSEKYLPLIGLLRFPSNALTTKEKARIVTAGNIIKVNTVIKLNIGILHTLLIIKMH
jgi:hypothetical protein